jgi:hypothetical protein
MENNKLIAEFMGIPTEVFWSGKVNYYFREFNSGSWYEEHELSYNVSWDWLMPVVQKIESLGYVFTIQGSKAEYGEMISETRCFIAEDKISSTYQAVVEFIKQYNNEK